MVNMSTFEYINTFVFSYPYIYMSYIYMDMNIQMYKCMNAHG